MKRKILAAVMMASITTAPFANELAKLSYSTNAITTLAANKPVEIIAAQVEKESAADDISQRIFIAQPETPMLAVLSAAEMEDTEGALWPLLGVLISMNVGAWSNHSVHYYYTGEPASVNSTVLAVATSAIPATRAAYGSYLGGQAAKTTFTTAHGYMIDGALLGVGAAASVNEAKFNARQQGAGWRSTTNYFRNESSSWEDK